MSAWQGLKASGPPEAGMSFFAPAASAEEMIALAWLLEEGSRSFYEAQAAALKDKEAAGLFLQLVTAEEHHKASLAGLYRDLSGKDPGPDLPGSIIGPDEPRMEGAVKVKDAIAWAGGRESREVLELAMALETDSYDLYIKMSRRAAEGKAKKVFDLLIAEEKQHLARMAEAMDRIA